MLGRRGRGGAERAELQRIADHLWPETHAAEVDNGVDDGKKINLVGAFSEMLMAGKWTDGAAERQVYLPPSVRDRSELGTVA